MVVVVVAVVVLGLGLEAPCNDSLPAVESWVVVDLCNLHTCDSILRDTVTYPPGQRKHISLPCTLIHGFTSPSINSSNQSS